MISVIRPEDAMDPSCPMSGAPTRSNFSSHAALSIPCSPQGEAHHQQRPPQGWGFCILERFTFVNQTGLPEERILVQEWIKEQANALEQVEVLTEALCHIATVVEALA